MQYTEAKKLSIILCLAALALLACAGLSDGALQIVLALLLIAVLANLGAVLTFFLRCPHCKAQLHLIHSGECPKCKGVLNTAQSSAKPNMTLALIYWVCAFAGALAIPLSLPTL